MKDRIKPLDVSIISSYMGRSLTAVIALFVIGVAVSALISERSGGERNIINICVPADGGESVDAVYAYEPFRVLLSGETRRPTVLYACSGEWPEGYDLYIMPVDAFFRDSGRLGIEALYEVKSSERHMDSAVLIGRSSEGEVDFSRVTPGEIAFSTPRSVNGFWIQMSMLSEMGLKYPGAASELRFEGSGKDRTRVILGVLYGAYRLGACKLTDLSDLTARGVLRAGELEVLRMEEALPEVIVAAPRGKASYFRRKLESIATRLEGVTSPASQSETVDLLRAFGIKGLRPIDPARLEKTRDLFERFSDFS